jgi:SAM-dependent methyltransferase
MKNNAVKRLNELWKPADICFSKPFDMRSLNRTPVWRREIAAGQKKVSEALLTSLQERHRCPVCDDTQTSGFVEIYGFSYRECSTCSHLFCSTPPDVASVKNFYTGAEDETKKSIQGWTYLDQKNYRKRLETIATPKVAFILKYVSPSAGHRWIDIGSGSGEILIASERGGWDATGIECDSDQCRFARKQGLTVQEGYITDGNAIELLADAKVVSLFNVLEHVEEPTALLTAIIAALDPGCMVVLEVPRHPSLSSLNNLLFPQVSCRHIIPPDHLHVFSDVSLHRMTSQCGITPVALWYFGQDFYDLLSSAIASSHISSSSIYDAVMDLAPVIQPVIDRAGLCDTLLYLGKKL